MHRNRDVVAVDQAVEAAEGRGLFEAEQEEFEKVVKTKALRICLQWSYCGHSSFLGNTHVTSTKHQ